MPVFMCVYARIGMWVYNIDVNNDAKESCMKVLDIFNPKGGNGKSMCAINLVAAVELGKDVMIIWQDPQGTSMLYGKGGKLPYEV